MVSNVPEYRLNHLRQALGERYAFEAFLGRGAFAAVFLVRNLRLERREALKVLYGTYEDDANFAKRFASEARLIASLDHPNIVQVYDFGEVDGIVWYSMQYIDGPTLRAELIARHQIGSRTAAQVVIPLLEALEYSHQQGIVHRDIKPSNILLNQRGRPYIMDFGIAKSNDSAIKTMTGSVLGTPVYMAPEQASGQDLDGRADLYALATMLYEMVAGEPPFKSDSPFQVMIRRLSEDPRPPSEIWPGIDQNLESIILRALQRDRGERYRDAAEMRQVLLNWLGNIDELERLRPKAKIAQPEALKGPREDARTRKINVGEPVSGEEPTRLVRPKKRWWPAALMLFALALGAIAWIASNSTPEQPPEPSETSRQAETASESTDPPTELSEESSESTVGESLGSEGAEDSGVEAPELSQVDAKDPAPIQQTASSEAPASQSPQNGSEPSERASPSAAPPTVPPQRSAPPPEPTRRVAIKQPQEKYRPDPVVDPELAKKCYGVTVNLVLEIEEDGSVYRARALGAVEPAECLEAAIETAMNYRFHPAEDFEGRPVRGRTSAFLEFGEIP